MDLPKNNSPELLMPVGTREMLEAAVKNGADAVYFGVPYWNARGRTEDFSMEDVKDMIRYARIHGVRTYLAMNVLVFERELQNLPEYLEKIISFKPDGFIIQDIGLARLIRSVSPTQEIHASTQMTLASAEGVNLVKSIGFNRAVLSRELSAKQIALVKENTDLELEVFVHGALCVSYSGQCLTSENFGGRSANRGQCAQSCRLPYRLFVDGKEEPNVPYLFSTHDLCALPKLEELAQAKVESLKVEGRLKSPEFVAAVTKAYRKALDQIASTANRGKESTSQWEQNHLGLSSQDLEPLEVLFSRGLTTGWLDGDNHQELVDGTFSNHHGLHLGRVAKVERNCVLVELSDKFISQFMGGNTPNKKNVNPRNSGENNPQKAGLPLPGDGILFEDSTFGISLGSRLYGLKSMGQTLRLEFGRDFDTRKIVKNMNVFRNDSPALEKELRKTFTDRTQEVKTPIEMTLEGAAQKKLKLHARIIDGKNNPFVEVSSESLLEEAKTPGDIESLARKELGGLSATAYRLERLDINLQGSPFVPGKLLRTLRQQAIEKLDESRLVWHDLKLSASRGKQFLSGIREAFMVSKSLARKSQSKESSQPEISVLIRNPSQIGALEGLSIDNVIMDFDWGVQYGEPLQQIHDLGFKAGMATLRIHKPGENHYLKKILELSPDFALVRNLGAIAILKDSGIPLRGDYSLNAANSASYQWLLDQGLSTLHPSWDLNSTQLFDLLENIDGSKLELTLHQYMPAFHSEYCAFARALTTGRRFPECNKICTRHKVEILDHKGERHFLQSDAECRNTLFVGRPQSALKLLPQLKKSGVHHFRLEMLQEDAETVRKKVQIYTQAIRGCISIEDAIREAGIQEKYGLSEGQLFNESTWQDRKKE